MKTGPRAGQQTKTDFVAKARAAWGDALPDWVLVLAEEANHTSGKAAGERIGYSGALVTHVVANQYGGDRPGDIARVAEKVRGALMGVVVVCPVYGEIGRDRCLDVQRKPFTAASSVGSRAYRACRATGQHRCPHSHVAKPE